MSGDVFKVISPNNGRIVIVGDGNITNSDAYVFDFAYEGSERDFKTYFTTFIERCAEGQGIYNYKVTISVEPLKERE